MNKPSFPKSKNSLRDNLTNIANVSNIDNHLLSLVQLELRSANITYRGLLERRRGDGRDFGVQQMGPFGREAIWVRQDCAWSVQLPPLTDKEKQLLSVKTHGLPGCEFDGTGTVTISKLSAMAPVAAVLSSL